MRAGLLGFTIECNRLRVLTYAAVDDVEVHLREFWQHSKQCFDVGFTYEELQVGFLVDISSRWTPS